jgi:citrate lyase subunit beta/citryl-CoA lyase
MSLPARSLLFVPADRPDRFDKAWASGAQAVIVDLEDAVPPARKAQARAALASWLAAERPVTVRVNAAGTPWFEEDLALARLPGVAALMLPKAEQVDTLRAVAELGRPLLPLIESALGLANVQALARVPGVQRLAFGAIDFQLDLGLADDVDLWPYRSQLVLASRVAALAAPIDGVSTAIDDAAALVAEVQRARREGFGGKLCIHPKQLAPVQAGFAPSAQDLAWAERVLEAAGRSEGAAVALDGRMIDRPVILRAQAFVDEAERLRRAGSRRAPAASDRPAS